MRRGFLRACSLLLGLLAAAPLAALASGCAGRSALETNPFLDAGPDADDADSGGPPIDKSDKIDLLLVVDNSPNTAVSHGLLTNTVPYLLDRLTRPACVNGLGNVVAVTPGPDDPCPVGQRDFKPVTDIHIGVISTSLGGHGADICGPKSPSFKPAQNDGARLLTRNAVGGTVPTYQNKGFLAWDPKHAAVPPGDDSVPALASKLVDLVSGTGETGCGFESQLESIYRFLVDPNPYSQIDVSSGKAVLIGTDATVLQQRADFLRPDSALVVVLVTDENDCSTRDGGQYFLSNQGGDPNGSGGTFHLPRPRSECATNPNDACCASCGQATPQGCSPSEQDPSCQAPPFTNLEDPVNLRCFDQKRRFGIEFLYPIQRYVDGLTNATISDRDGNVVDNPIFKGGRSAELVMLAGIVGVPWQDIAKDPKALATGFSPAAEIDWALVVGDPATSTKPTDPLMVESVEPRSGSNPPTGAALAPPGSPFATSNPINGHERDIAGKDDLQYACIYPLPTPTACVDPPCPCTGKDIDGNPICQAPDGSYGATQQFARGVPGTRELRVLQGLGDRAVVGSVCAQTSAEPEQPIFGFKPSVDAVLRTLRLRLR